MTTQDKSGTLLPKSAVNTNVPRYVLMEGNRRIGPHLAATSTEVGSTPIYGFSSKRTYDQFCGNSPLSLIPYPLVQGFLQNQANEPGDGIKLVIVDALGPRESCLHAATIGAVLEAHTNKSAYVTAEYSLTFDPDANSYSVEAASVPRRGT